jgi:hypothetical protein
MRTASDRTDIAISAKIGLDQRRLVRDCSTGVTSASMSASDATHTLRPREV